MAKRDGRRPIPPRTPKLPIWPQVFWVLVMLYLRSLVQNEHWSIRWFLDISVLLQLWILITMIMRRWVRRRDALAEAREAVEAAWYGLDESQKPNYSGDIWRKD